MGNGIDHTAHKSSRLACQRIVRGLIEKHDWALASEEELAELVLDSSQSDVTPAEAKRLATHQYSIVLYEACRQAKDLGRRERGYSELFRYLYKTAYYKWPEWAEDATQQALLLVFEQIDRCRDPGTFLAFAYYKLLEASKQVRPPKQPEPSLDQTKWKTPAPGVDALELGELLEAIGRLPEICQKVILLKFLGGQSDAEIAEQLGTSVNNVRVRRHRCIKQLRKAECLRGYFEG